MVYNKNADVTQLFSLDNGINRRRLLSLAARSGMGAVAAATVGLSRGSHASKAVDRYVYDSGFAFVMRVLMPESFFPPLLPDWVDWKGDRRLSISTATAQFHTPETFSLTEIMAYMKVKYVNEYGNADSIYFPLRRWVNAGSRLPWEDLVEQRVERGSVSVTKSEDMVSAVANDINGNHILSMSAEYDGVLPRKEWPWGRFEGYYALLDAGAPSIKQVDGSKSYYQKLMANVSQFYSARNLRLNVSSNDYVLTGLAKQLAQDGGNPLSLLVYDLGQGKRLGPPEPINPRPLSRG